ncbi:MAG: CRISPR-associated helicase Cas3' [Azospirillaceae bacterium]|nr:CRISPR-associated helicase Cas3' [Azospirillaceae bacterium]
MDSWKDGEKRPPAAVALGKTDRAADGTMLVLTLADHCADVAAVFQTLLAQPTIRRRLAALIGVDGDLDPVTCARLCVLAALHDTGKVTARFQKRIRGEGTGGGHIGPLVALLHAQPASPAQRRVRSRVTTAMMLPTLIDWFAGTGGLEDLLTGILAHHGRLNPTPAPVLMADWTADKTGYDPLAALDDLSTRVRHWFPDAFSETAAPLPVNSRLCYAVAGLTVWADWLGSDVGAFPLMPVAALDAPRDDRFAESCRQAAVMMRGRALDAGLRQSRAAALVWNFATLFPEAAARGWQPRPMQAAMIDLDADRHAPGTVLVLEAETGSGKTEAAIALFLKLLRHRQVDGLYFALPTRASAVQIQRRISTLLRAALGDAAPPVGLAVPGYLRVDDADGQRLPGFRVAWPDGDTPRIDDRRWAAAHNLRYLAGPVMVGTIDQLLLAGLPVRHAPFRSAAMLRQLLVIDEVHASDPYMTELLGHVLDQHRAAGGSTLLMSATLGAVARTRLTDRGGVTLPLAAARTVPYPCLHGRPDTATTPATDGERPPKNITVEQHPLSALDALVRTAVAAARTGAHVLILRNTVRDAMATQTLVEQACPDPTLLLRIGEIPSPHHARFAAEDRIRLDAELEKAFGGERSPGGMIAVTTQTAEQSLDIDADLCPADVLLQRLGRLHRRERPGRPPDCARPRALILAPALESLAGLITPAGAGTVYRALLALAATLEQLGQTPVLPVPTVNRALVEAITHPDALRPLAQRLDGAETGPWPAPSRWIGCNGIRRRWRMTARR